MTTKEKVNEIFIDFTNNILIPFFKTHPELSKEYFYSDGSFRSPINLYYSNNDLPKIKPHDFFLKKYPDIWLHIKLFIDQVQNEIYM